jgi:regulator of sirC expression with transglutaminase-like and TPR domain
VRAALLLAFALSAAACRQPAPPPPLTSALLEVGEPTPRERAAALEEIGRLAAAVEARLRAGLAPAEALNAVVFGERGFAREVDDTDPRFMRLAAVLAARRGSCLGLAAVYLALGERLGPAHGFGVAGVLVPGHLFVRVVDAGGARDVELLRGGERMPERWYREKYQIPEPTPAAYLRPLRPAEVLAVLDYNLGNDHRGQGRLDEAARAYRRAAAAFPQLAEAHASLGLVRHLSGALDEAERAYQAAQAANPRLPGLEKNLAVVRDELGRGATAAPARE